MIMLRVGKHDRNEHILPVHHQAKRVDRSGLHHSWDRQSMRRLDCRHLEMVFRLVGSFGLSRVFDSKQTFACFLEPGIFALRLYLS